jgi:hypothetical protein
MARRCMQDGECIIPATTSRNLCVYAVVFMLCFVVISAFVDSCEGNTNSIKKL